jgi:TalC/MipB family fructose-6-phosphate aldolase
MALYIDSAFLDDITRVTRTVPVAGVTTNPSIMLAAQERGQMLNPGEVLNELLRLAPGDIFIQPGATDEKGMFHEAISSIQVAPRRIIPKIPMTHAGMRVARTLKQQNYRIAFTAVASVTQAYAASMIQADFIIPYYSRLERSGIDASERIAEMAELLHNEQSSTRILTASIKSPEDAAAPLLAGSHDLTVAPQILLEMITDPLTDEAVERFSVDWQKMKKL